MTHPKVPGWGLAPVPIVEARAGPQGQPQALICPAGHEACFWADLLPLAHHRARVIYHPIHPHDIP